jgi:hypothetical protein
MSGGPYALRFGPEILKSGVYLRRKKIAPRVAVKLAAMAIPVAEMEKAAGEALVLLEGLQRDTAVRLPYANFDQVLADLRKAVGT